ncbi:AAA family ATPase [Methanobrevibacter filiformis]|uniref:Dephospho-CoA kinase n=1 Tax=Methanobrevibacter filiformis TaxID=55758 RepID=A0A166EZQ4_9EURY|nr:AAA family ATPase [Methanobrevibacter filiformis]KZX17175.1 dephospho-CoA kinase [Methanobrevibacter filiformis]
MNVIGVSGLPGSGKSLISKIAIEQDFNVFNMGDIVREESKKRNKSSSETAVELRKEHGDYVVAKFTINKILNLNFDKNTKVMIEGIRSQYEVELFKESFKEFKIISVFASPTTRFERLKSRNRSDDSINYEDFNSRDKRELNFGIGNVVACSDYMIINESNLEDYEKNIDKIFDKIFK